MSSESYDPNRSLDATRSLAPPQSSSQIESLGEQFVLAWRAGQKRRIEDYLDQVPAKEQNLLLRVLLSHEISLRQQAGESPTLEHYVTRFPEHVATVAQLFSQTDKAAGTDSTVDLNRSLDLSTQDLLSPRPQTDSPRTGSLRYHKLRKLGEGAFGAVRLAEDLELKRQVALKEPRPDRLRKAAEIETYLAEARVLASLDHPHIVPVYDVGRTVEGSCYVVSKLIDGTDLADHAKQKPITFAAAASLVAQIAEALQHTHNRGLVHRDIKPANILIDSQNRPYVTDFGLALRDEDFGKQEGIAGTPAYMSPEQARGESHLVDGRSDIFSLGVVLYELLTGSKPFRGDNWREILQRITTVEAKPLRQLNEAIPKELERICLKALSKRATDRYSCAADLAEDLRNWSRPTADQTAVAAAKIVPKGLRSFDAADSDFFLQLLPGPRDRDGLPESLRFWKTRIEETDSDRTFRVGLVYGPSGCGKSSLMKAGLLPRLSDHVVRVFLEATPDQTEQQLLQVLRRACPDLPRAASLVDTLAAIRRGKGIPAGRKVVLVIDQFEQWLYSHSGETNSDLAAALRQCDGGRIQAVLLVRDDFWMPVSEFLRVLEVPLLEGINANAVSLFDPLHARKVLSEFGKAYGRLPENLGKISRDQDSFLTQSVTGLSQDGKVISVRLALFSDMMKSRPWTPAALAEVGGTAGVGATFLEETFTSRTAPPQHRQHQEAARAVLRALLPTTGADIKGHMRSASELREFSGYNNRPDAFAELIRILDSEVRLITPVGSETLEAGSEKPTDPSSPSSSTSTLHPTPTTLYYQLTHDYLVPSLRDWLTRKQRETRRGRAELKLEERAMVWNSKPENRLLPSLLDWLNIRLLTDKWKWTEPQRKMMRRAAKVHGLTWGGALVSLLVLGLSVQYWVSQRDWSNKQEQTRIAAESLQNNLGSSIPVNIRELKKLPESLVQAELAGRFVTDNSRHKLALAFALAAYGQVETEYLISRIDDVATADTANIVEALAIDRERAVTLIKAEAAKCDAEVESFWQTPAGRQRLAANWEAAKREADSFWRRKAKLAIAALALGETEIAADMCQYEDRHDPGQRTIFINEFPQWEWYLSDRKINLQQLANLVAESRDSGWRSGVSLAVGSIPVDQLRELNPSALDAWNKLVGRWFKEHRDTSTHSAASWLLRQWKLPLPEVPDQHEILTDRDWFVNSTKMTMLRIRPPAIQRDTKSQLSEYWIASCEVTRGQFESFMQDAEYKFEKPTDSKGVDTDTSPTSDHPAQQVSWYDAVMYCNWLSRQEGKTPAYHKTGDQWELVAGATGYRLPLVVEWEYSIKAGSQTAWSSGGDEQLLADYCQMFPSNLAAVVGHKLPNAWGMQDVHGNVAEWCNDLWGEGSYRVSRGGGWAGGAAMCGSSTRSRDAPTLRTSSLGFRLALSSPGIPESAEPEADE